MTSLDFAAKYNIPTESVTGLMHCDILLEASRQSVDLDELNRLLLGYYHMIHDLTVEDIKTHGL